LQGEENLSEDSDYHTKREALHIYNSNSLNSKIRGSKKEEYEKQTFLKSKSQAGLNGSELRFANSNVGSSTRPNSKDQFHRANKNKKGLKLN
jgi:hypothetical protein